MHHVMLNVTVYAFYELNGGKWTFFSYYSKAHTKRRSKWHSLMCDAQLF